MPTINKVNYFLFCEHFSKDEQGRLSLNGIFDVIGGEKFPIVPAKFSIVINVNIDVGDIKDGQVVFKILLEDPRGKQIVKIEALGEISKAGKVATNIPLDGRITFPKKGTYSTKLFINDKQIAESPIQVVLGKREDYKK